MSADTVTPKMAGELLGFSKRTAITKCENGAFPGATRDEKGYWSIPLSEVEAYRDRMRSAAQHAASAAADITSVRRGLQSIARKEMKTLERRARDVVAAFETDPDFVNVQPLWRKCDALVKAYHATRPMWESAEHLTKAERNVDRVAANLAQRTKRFRRRS